MSRPIDPIVFEVLAWTGTAVETKRVSTHSITTLPSDTPANTYYAGVIGDPGSIKWAMFDGTATNGQASVDVGFIELVNADGVLDPWYNYQWGRVGVVKSLADRNSMITSATELYRATVIGIETSDALRKLRLRLRSRMVELDVPLLSTRYAGTTITSGATAEGNADLTGQIKPYIFGSTPNVRPKLVNQFNLLYQFAANPVTSIVVYDGGIPLSPPTEYGSLSALVNATVAPGSYATCLSQGIVRLGAPAAFTVTGDVVEGATLADRSAARVIQRMLALVSTISSGDIDTASFDAFHTFNPAEVGIFIDSDATAIDQISKVADSVGGTIIQGTGGIFQAKWLAVPSLTVEDTYTLRELIGEGGSFLVAAGPSSDGQGVPAWLVIVNWGKIWSVMSTGELAPRIALATEGADAARKDYLSTEMRQAPFQDSGVQTSNPLAVTLTFDTLLTQQADATAEAARRLDLYRFRRDRLVVTTSWDRGNIDLGKTVKLQFRRLGYEAGKYFVVLGREDDLKRKVRTLTLWG